MFGQCWSLDCQGSGMQIDCKRKLMLVLNVYGHRCARNCRRPKQEPSSASAQTAVSPKCACGARMSQSICIGSAFAKGCICSAWVKLLCPWSGADAIVVQFLMIPEFRLGSICRLTDYIFKLYIIYRIYIYNMYIYMGPP